MLDLEELLAKIPQLIARLTRFSAFSVYLLDEKRKELRIAYAVGYPGDASPNMRLKVGQGVVGTAVEEGRPILVNDIRREPRYRGPLAQHALAARRSAAAQGQGHRRAQPAERGRRRVHDAGRSASASVRGARGGGDRERAALRVRASAHRHARGAGRDRARDVVDSRPRRLAHTHRQPHEAPR